MQATTWGTHHLRASTSTSADLHRALSPAPLHQAAAAVSPRPEIPGCPPSRHDLRGVALPRFTVLPGGRTGEKRARSTSVDVTNDVGERVGDPQVRMRLEVKRAGWTMCGLELRCSVPRNFFAEGASGGQIHLSHISATQRLADKRPWFVGLRIFTCRERRVVTDGGDGNARCLLGPFIYLCAQIVCQKCK
jgi:hypothetical protein